MGQMSEEAPVRGLHIATSKVGTSERGRDDTCWIWVQDEKGVDG